MTGPFIVKGMGISIADFSVSVNEDGSLSGSLSLNLRYDACIAWLKIALEHRNQALEGKKHRISAWATDDDEEKGRTLEAEFQASLQAIVAAASAVDAFYAQIASQFPIASETKAAWQKNKTARASQVYETIKYAFGLAGGPHEEFRKFIQALYKIRDAALHPTGKHQPPHFHNEIGCATDWRFWTFRSQVADSIVCNTTSMLWYLSEIKGHGLVQASNFQSEFRKRLSSILQNGVPTPEINSINFWLPIP